MSRLSAFLITKNEANDIAGCLESLKGWVHEIIVVDDESSDATVSICQRYNAKTFSRKLDGFAAQKQFALDQTTGDWVFSIDADERVTPPLATEIQRVIELPSAATGYEIPRDMFFLGHRLRFGGVGRDWVLRLFQRTKGRFKPVRVHERVEVDGPTGRLSAPLQHFSYASLDEYVQKANHYTTLAAQDMQATGRKAHLFDFLRPAWELLIRVGFKGAWLDGKAGLTYAALSSHTAWLRTIKLWELERNGRG